jgi:hypothetical protein
MTENLPALPEEVMNLRTGELLPATPENAAVVLDDLRRLRQLINEASALCRDILAEESRRQGTKTLHLGELTAEVHGGSEVVWDIETLEAELLKAGCPQERMDALISETVEYKVNNTVARQLAAANPDYASAIEAAKERVPAPIRVSVRR